MLKMTFWKEDSPKIKNKNPKEVEGKYFCIKYKKSPMCQYISNGQCVIMLYVCK